MQKQAVPNTTAATAAAAASTADDPTNAVPPTGTRNQLRPVLSFADSFACTYIVSVIGAANAELVTYPLDLTKTRLQIQGEASSKNAVAAGGKGQAPVSELCTECIYLFFCYNVCTYAQIYSCIFKCFVCYLHIH